MASIQETGGKRGLNPEVNLVPFIDLLSVCICFLLISAVWLNVGSLQVKQAYGTAADEPPKELVDVDIAFTGPFSIVYQVKQKTQTIVQLEIKHDSREAMMAELGEKLTATIATLRGDQAELTVADMIASASITPSKDANYDSLISVMDVLRKHEIVNLAVIPKAG